MQDLAQRFAENWKRKRFPAHSPVLLAVSGGVDSMVLAHLMLAGKIPFAVAHVNFGLRGDDSDADAALVKGWCGANSIPLHTKQIFVKELNGEFGKNIQIAARQSRYIYFKDLLEEHRYAAVATAHHIDDVAETLLINLSRGTGISGMHGIPENAGGIIRPLLFATHGDILAYARAAGIKWREDASNANDAYLRNAIRHHILPKLDELMPDVAKRMAETAERLRGTEIIYRKALGRRLTKLKEQRGKDWYIPILLLEKEEALLTVAYELFSPFGFTGEQIPQILALMQGESGRQISASEFRVIRHRDFLIITSLAETSAGLILIHNVPSITQTEEGIFRFSWAGATTPITDNTNVAMLNGDRLVFPLTLRIRKEGDYFYPLGMGMKKKKLKRFLIDTKTPLHEKERVRVLESDKRILWIAGKRIDERFKVLPATKRILQVVFEPKENAKSGMP